MKFLEALFDDRGRVHLYVYNNRKIERGLSIKNYIYAFDNTDEKILFFKIKMPWQGTFDLLGQLYISIP